MESGHISKVAQASLPAVAAVSLRLCSVDNPYPSTSSGQASGNSVQRWGTQFHFAIAARSPFTVLRQYVRPTRHRVLIVVERNDAHGARSNLLRSHSEGSAIIRIDRELRDELPCGGELDNLAGPPRSTRPIVVPSPCRLAELLKFVTSTSSG